MTELTGFEIRQLKEERSLTTEQVAFLQNMLRKYGSYSCKEDIINNYRKFGYMSEMLERDLQQRFDKKQ